MSYTLHSEWKSTDNTSFSVEDKKKAIDYTAWAKIVIERWQAKITKLNVFSTGELIKSFTSIVTSDANGNAEKIQFMYLYYGIFSELGVGKGVTMDKVSQSNRVAKPWYNTIFFREITILANMVAESYGVDASHLVKYILQSDQANATTLKNKEIDY